MQNEFVGKFIFTTYMDYPNEGSGNLDCDCDMADGSTALNISQKTELHCRHYYLCRQIKIKYDKSRINIPVGGIKLAHI